MAEYKDGLLSLASFRCGEEGPHERGVVVYLESHRRWRSRPLLDQDGDDAEDGGRHIDAEDCSRVAPGAEDKTEMASLLAPSLWLAGLVMLIAVTSIIGLYWAFTAAVMAFVRFSLAHF